MDMASAIMPETSSTSSLSTSSPPPLNPSRTIVPNLHNPLPLSAAQEAQVRDIYYRKVREKCAAEIKDFAVCARSRTVTATWLCRQQRLAMNSCMIIHATREEEDRARDEWFQGVEERRKKKELEQQEVEKRRDEVFRIMRQQEEKERKEKENTGKKGWWG